MSSHHIVRDEQEPALLLWQPGQASFEQAGELLAWSPRVLVHRQALREALAWGIKLDAVWALPDDLPATTAAVAHQQPVSVLPLPAQDALQAVLHWLKAKQQSSVYLLTDATTDNFKLLQQLQSLQQLVQVQVISQGWRYSYFKSALVFKWLPRGSVVKTISFKAQPVPGGAEAMRTIRTPYLQEIALQQSGMLSLKAATPFWFGEEL